MKLLKVGKAPNKVPWASAAQSLYCLCAYYHLCIAHLYGLEDALLSGVPDILGVVLAPPVWLTLNMVLGRNNLLNTIRTCQVIEIPKLEEPVTRNKTRTGTS